jgi:hypothetical protein
MASRLNQGIRRLRATSDDPIEKIICARALNELTSESTGFGSEDFIAHYLATYTVQEARDRCYAMIMDLGGLPALLNRKS